MLSLAFTLFLAGVLTILLPCILPLIPIVLGVSIAGRSRWRPVNTIAGMLVSFIGFTFLLTVFLNQFVEFADYIRIGTYYVLLLFGLGFLTYNNTFRVGGALLGGAFFWDKGPLSTMIAALVGVILMEVGGRIATRIQQFGTDVQHRTMKGLGEAHPATAFIVGLTMGLVWVPCAGPALGLVLTLIREQPGLRALFLLSVYGLGTAVPLLLIGYGGQAAVHSVRFMSRYSGIVKRAAGVILILTALSLQFHILRDVETWLVQHSNFGTLGVDLEMKLFGNGIALPMPNADADRSPTEMNLPNLPKIARAPELKGLGPWHNIEPLTMAELRGKVVLVDFWTYSCINCIRTLPYMRGYWEKFKDSPFVLLGIHTPEFVFEKSEANVAEAIARHGLTYPIAQDNDYGTWQAFANRYWPAKYLIDADGYIRYTHFGEGAYEETEKAIISLLQEIGEKGGGEALEALKDVEALEERRYRELTPETYLGLRSYPALGNGPRQPRDDVVTYEAPDAMELHKYYLVGDWQMVEDERQVLRSDEGEIRMKFLGAEMNLVLGPPGEGMATVDVEADGQHQRSFDVDFDDLYNIFSGEYGEHEVIMRISGRGTSAYAFTFGS